MAGRYDTLDHRSNSPRQLASRYQLQLRDGRQALT